MRFPEISWQHYNRHFKYKHTILHVSTVTTKISQCNVCILRDKLYLHENKGDNNFTFLTMDNNKDKNQVIIKCNECNEAGRGNSAQEEA